MSPKRVLFASLAAAALAWATLVAASFADRGGSFADAQRELFFRRGVAALNDYYMPWKCAHEGYAQVVDEVEYAAPDGRILTMERLDRCYPPLILGLYRTLPYSNFAAAASSFAWAAVFLLALAAVARASGASPRDAFAFVATGFFLFALERANPVPLAAAAVAIFLAWHDSPCRKRRLAAAVALALAVALKLSPALLGVLYLRRRDWRQLALSAGLALALVLLPFFLPGGAEGLSDWFAAALRHGREMAPFSAFGYTPFVRAVRILEGADWKVGIGGWCLATKLTGLLFLAGAAVLPRRNDAILWAVTGLLLAPGNMLFYAGLYLVPVCLMRSVDWRRDSRRDWLEAAVWFVLFAALQLPYGGFTLNRLAAAAAVFALPFFAIRKGGV